jgi:hypothetical protein
LEFANGVDTSSSRSASHRSNEVVPTYNEKRVFGQCAGTLIRITRTR